VAGAAAPLAVAAALHPFRDDVSTANAVLLLALVVVGVATTGSRVAGLVAALSATLWFDFFLTEPYSTFTISSRDDVETAVLLAVVGLAVTEIALWGRRQQARSSGRAGYLDGLVEAAGLAARADVDRAALVEVVGEQVREVLGVDSVRFESGRPGGGHPHLERDGTLVHAGGVLDVDRTGLPTWDVVELPVASGGVALGRYVVTAASRTAYPDAERRRVAVALADQVGAALGRDRQDRRA
jgi:K+-sensing histidine kinase KdpD